MVSFALIAASLICCIMADNYVWTPHGLRLSQCVHHHPSEVIIETILNSTHDGVLAFHPSSAVHTFYPTLPECVQEAANIMFNNPGTGVDHNWQQSLVQDDTPTLGSFEGYYTLPNESPQQSGDVLSFFIGMANKGQGQSVQQTIIQPCIRYNGNGWSMAAWNCCPDGQSHEGNIVQLPTNAKNIYGFCSSNASYIFVKAEYEGKVTSITQPNKLDGKARIFNSIDVTLEQHNAENCNDYNKKPFNFTNLKIKTESGANLTPKWTTLRNNNSCHGGIKAWNDFDISIWGADKPN
eukprot:301738_1